MWLTLVHSIATTNYEKKGNMQNTSKQRFLSLTTLTNLFFFRVCSSEAGSNQVAGGAEEATGGGAEPEVMSW